MRLETVTGLTIDVNDPRPEDINIDDIAWSLSRKPRFCGHTITEIPYNVAQHSIFVAKELERMVFHPEEYPEVEKEIEMISNRLTSNPNEIRNLCFLGLIHDASEVYTGDVPSPVKRIPELYPIFKRIEEGLMNAIYLHFKVLPPEHCQEVLIKHADKISQKIEAHAFMQSRGSTWPNMPSVSLEKLQKFENPMSSLESYKQFKECFEHFYTLSK